MFGPNSRDPGASCSLDALDRVAIAYMTLPLLIFLIGWLNAWAAFPLVACVVYSLRALFNALPATARVAVTPLQLAVAIIVGCVWTVFGGTGHLVFANSDWHIRDSVLHDLVVSPWPVGYGAIDGKQSLLRAPLGYYLPAALVGKWAGLAAAHVAMAVWTAIGATLFLLQALSLTPSRAGTALMVATVVVLFSGLDIVGNIVSVPGFIASWDITRHLEWWAGSYQYSSMTTQLFWVPNHALGGWLTIGLMCRDQRNTSLDAALPMTLVAVALWSPLTALGIVPFVIGRAFFSAVRDRSWRLLYPPIWAPALVVGIVISAYLTLDTGHIPRGVGVGANGIADVVMDLLRQAQFFLLEAGLIGFAVLAIRRSSQVVLALVVLALLPLISFGPGNDLVMRASIPSLAALTIGTCRALCKPVPDVRRLRYRRALVGMLVVGAVTPIQEFARAAVVPAWPINLQITLIGAACGRYPDHYVARLSDQTVLRLLRTPNPLPLGPQGRQACDNPAVDLMWKRGLP
jgi:hypothetical protein